MTEANWPAFPLGPEGDIRTQYLTLPEMRLTDLEAAIQHCDDAGERGKLEELLEKYRHLLRAGFTVDEVVEHFDFSWCKPDRFDARLQTRSWRPR